MSQLKTFYKKPKVKMNNNLRTDYLDNSYEEVGNRKESFTMVGPKKGEGVNFLTCKKYVFNVMNKLF